LHKSDLNSYLKLHLIIFIWGFTAILGKLISLPAENLVWHRILIAIIALKTYLWFKKEDTKLAKKDIIKLSGIGIIIALHWLFFFKAIKVSNVSVTLACLSSTAFFTSILEPILLKRRIVGFELLLGLTTIAGLYMIYSFEFGYITGIILAITSALMASLFATLNAVMVRSHSPATITYHELKGGWIVLSIYLLFSGGFSAETLFISLSDFTYLLILGTICTAFAFVVGVEILKKIPPFTVNLAVNLEPVYGIILALIIFKDSEEMKPGFYTGAGIILLAIVLNAVLKRAFKPKLAIEKT
jgi:drug/metabolite transporter (DMT)-like permease